jgi:hypothetical protein
MKKFAYLECPAGIAGDMCLGALVDVGVPLEYLIARLQSLGIEEEYRLTADRVYRNAQVATKVNVDLAPVGHTHHHRHLPQIKKIINRGDLPERVRSWSLQVFDRLAIAEGAVHGIPPEQVHFHEVGATDAIVDIVGTCLGLDWLGIEEIYCSAMPTGGGTIKAAHGRLPVPVPAVLKLWELGQVPVYNNGIDRELVTPTGAAIAIALAKSFGAPPAMQLKRIGLGAGTIDLPMPNLLRLWLGEVRGEEELETIAVLETQIDDLSPQAIAYTLERLLEAGALDVFTQAIGMKKSRSGILLTVICHLEQISICEEIIFQETTTLGIRRRLQQRRILERYFEEIETKYGKVRVKFSRFGNNKLQAQPEYDDCARLARENNISLVEIQQMALLLAMRS